MFRDGGHLLALRHDRAGRFAGRLVVDYEELDTDWLPGHFGQRLFERCALRVALAERLTRSILRAKCSGQSLWASQADRFRLRGVIREQIREIRQGFAPDTLDGLVV